VVLGAAGADGVNVGCGMPGACMQQQQQQQQQHQQRQ
jgi:hypothetical protein